MFGLKYIKADPSTHLMLFQKGNVIQEGVGVSFFYYAPSSSLVAIPSNSKERVNTNFEVFCLTWSEMEIPKFYT